MSGGKPRKEYLEQIKKEEIEEGVQKTLFEGESEEVIESGKEK